MKITCPSCSTPVPAADVSLETGWAKCGACQEVFALAGVLPDFGQAARGGSAKRPFDARVRVERPGRDLLVLAPAQGLGLATLWGLGFSAFWLTFIAFWSWGAAGGLSEEPAGAANWIFACFSIPFWLVGLSMLAWTVWSAWGTSSVRIGPERMVMQRRCLGWSRTRSVERRRVQHARPARAYWAWGANNYYQLPHGVEIVYERGSFALSMSGEDEERWLLDEINGFLASRAE